MNRSKWMPVLLAGGLACTGCAVAQTGGGTPPSPSPVTYDSSKPDNPFVGAWDGEQLDCSDPHAETKCWKCEQSASGNSAFPVPKYWYETEVTCPQLKIKEKTHNECVCELVGTKKTVQVQATADTTEGKWRYVPKGEPGCGKNGPDNPIKFKEIKWAWKTIGRPGGDIMNMGDLATFDYVVPKGDVDISVVFKARGFPDHAQCGVLTSASRVVGRITGAGYEKYIPPPTPRNFPNPEYVEGMIVRSDGESGFGSSSMSMSQYFECKPVCEDSSCPLYRIEGKFGYYAAEIRVVSCIKVTVDGCNLPPSPRGSCKPRSKARQDETLEHEKKHLVIYWDFIDEWNRNVENLGLFDSCNFANKEKDKLISDFTKAKIALNKRQESHCPDYAGAPIYDFNGCGDEIFMDKFLKCN